MNSTLLFSDNQEEYSDLFAVSGTSLLAAEDQSTDQNSLIHLTPIHPRTSYNNNNDQNTTPTNIIDQSISAFDLLPAVLTPSTPSCRNKKPSAKITRSPKISIQFKHHDSSSYQSNHTHESTWSSSNLPRTQSVDLIALHLQETPRATVPRSKSTTSILNPPRTAHPPKVTKSILKRPNSPSKRARARFFSPSLLSSESSKDDLEPDQSDWVDENGNLKAREIIHEFQHDQPPNIHPKPFHYSPSSNKPPNTTFTPPKVTTTSAYARHRRHSHTPRFTIPEPIDLGIEPILPRRSTSPSPSPPSSPPSSYLINAKPRHRDGSAIDQVNQHESNRSISSSLLFNTSENLSNILDQSDGFLVGNDTTLNTADNKVKDRSTELSIDLNHVAMLEILGKKNAINGHISSNLKGLSKKSNHHLSQCTSVPEEEDSVDVCGLAKQLEDKDSFPLGNPALNDEQAPINLQGYSDFSTTFESSIKLNLPPLLTDEEEIWKNSIPQKNKDEKYNILALPIDGGSKFIRPKTKSMSNFDTLAPRKKIEEINLTIEQKIQVKDTRFQTKDDLFSELMFIEPPSSSFGKPQKLETNEANGTAAKPSRIVPVKNLPLTRPSTRSSTVCSRLSGPTIIPTVSSKIMNRPGLSSGSPVSKPRTSCISTTCRVPLGPRRGSNIGMGMPSSSSVPNMTKLSIRTQISNTHSTNLAGNRIKVKPSNAIIKTHSTSGSPKLMMKNRSSISNQNLNSGKLSMDPTPTNNHQLSPVTTSKTSIRKTLRPSSVLNLPSHSDPIPPSSIVTYKNSHLSRLPLQCQIKKK